MNLNVEQWSSDALIESYGISQCYDILEYYFSNNTEKIINGKNEVEQDKKDRQERRKLAREWLSE